MSRSGYSEDIDSQQLNVWRGAVASAVRGRRGQEFLRDMLAALDAMPEKRLITGDLVRDGDVCAIGSVGVARGIDMSSIDPEVPEDVARAFGVARSLVCEIEWVNDEMCYGSELPEERHARVRAWVASQITGDPGAG